MMDNTQIYAAVLLFVSLLSTGYSLAFFEGSNIERFGKLLGIIFGYALSVPLYGRIFGWW